MKVLFPLLYSPTTTSKRSQSIQIRSRAVGLREYIAYAQHEATFERDQLPLLSGKNLFQGRNLGWMMRVVGLTRSTSAPDYWPPALWPLASASILARPCKDADNSAL